MKFTLLGYNCQFLNGSYSCPHFSLYGYGTERGLENAIKRQCRLLWKSTAAANALESAVKVRAF